MVFFYIGMVIYYGWWFFIVFYLIGLLFFLKEGAKEEMDKRGSHIAKATFTLAMCIGGGIVLYKEYHPVSEPNQSIISESKQTDERD